MAITVESAKSLATYGKKQNKKGYSKVNKEDRHTQLVPSFLITYFRDAANVLGTIVRAKAQVFVQTEANVIPIKAVTDDAGMKEGLFKSSGKSGFARSRQASKPDGQALKDNKKRHMG
jgi:hypothetical protein